MTKMMTKTMKTTMKTTNHFSGGGIGGGGGGGGGGGVGGGGGGGGGDARVEELLGFWFGVGGSAGEIAEAKAGLWWGKGAETDGEIGRRWGGLVKTGAAVAGAGGRGELAGWRETPRGLLALIICMDQFTRCLYRGSAEAFGSDGVALGLAKEGVEGGAVRKLQPIERVFAYLPFEHSEVLAEQETSLALFRELADEAAGVSDAEGEVFANFYEFARKHYVIIERFGRFPHRNAVLGRASTEEELAFLQEAGSSF